MSCSVRGGFERLKALVEPYVGPLAVQEHGTQWYEQRATAEYGAVVCWSPRSGRETRPDECMLKLPQRECDRLGWDQVAELVVKLRNLGAHFTRVDVYADDRRRIVEPREVLDTFRAGRVVSHIRRSRLIDDGEEGVTVNLGSRESEAFVRVYDKDAEQKAPKGTYGIRWEIEAKGDRSAWIVQVVVLAERDKRGQEFAAALVALVDFRDRDGEQNGTRAPRLVWWSELVADVLRATMARIHVVDSLVRRERWIRKQVSPTLALLLHARGGDLDWLVSMCRQGSERLGLAQWRLLEGPLRPQVLQT